MNMDFGEENMKLIAKVINEKTKLCMVAEDKPNFRKFGYTDMEVEQAYDGNWYVKGYAPEKPVEELQAEVRAVRNSYLEKYVDPKQLVMVWDSLSADDKKLYADYRIYLLDYTKDENWYLQNPKTLEEWKNSAKPVEEIKDLPVVEEAVVPEMENAEETNDSDIVLSEAEEVIEDGLQREETEVEEPVVELYSMEI